MHYKIHSGDTVEIPTIGICKVMEIACMTVVPEEGIPDAQIYLEKVDKPKPKTFEFSEIIPMLADKRKFRPFGFPRDLWIESNVNGTLIIAKDKEPYWSPYQPNMAELIGKWIEVT